MLTLGHQLRWSVRILDLHLSKLPSNASAFYMQPMPQLPKLPSKPWYKVTPVGVNPLKAMMAQISCLAGLTGVYTNHSLRATSASWMFAAGVPEKFVAEFVGHKSIQALRQYIWKDNCFTTASCWACNHNCWIICSKCSYWLQTECYCGWTAAQDQKQLPSIAGTHTNCTFNFQLLGPVYRPVLVLTAENSIDVWFLFNIWPILSVQYYSYRTCRTVCNIIVQLLHTQCVCSIDKSTDYSHNRYSYYSHRLL